MTKHFSDCKDIRRAFFFCVDSVDESESFIFFRDKTNFFLVNLAFSHSFWRINRRRSSVLKVASVSGIKEILMSLKGD